MSKQPTAAETVQAMVSELNNSKAKKADLLEQLDTIEQRIRALASALQGVQLGQQLQQELRDEPEGTPSED